MVSGNRSKSRWRPDAARPVAGLVTVLSIIGVFVISAGLFRGSFAESVPVTVLSPRAGLVMNPDAKVKLLDIQVGHVSSIEYLADGQAALHLAMDPDQIHLVPDNVLVDIASTTVFGAKFVQLKVPAQPSTQPIRAGQTLQADRVTVEINTVFQRLTQVLAHIDPMKLSETLGALSSALDGRGEKFGQALTDFEALLAKFEPNLPNLSHVFEAAPIALDSYADAADDLVSVVDNTSNFAATIVDRQSELDALLVSVIGLAEIGNDVLATNRQPLTDLLHLLVPTTSLTNEYHRALTCGLAGMLPLAHLPPQPEPGVLVSAGFTLATERYRYPSNLPKVAAKGGPQCMALPDVPFNYRAPYLVTDVGIDPAQYGNQGILLNSDGLKRALFGPIDGPPRNSTQIGQPG